MDEVQDECKYIQKPGNKTAASTSGAADSKYQQTEERQCGLALLSSRH
jgi:hypothetical protein